MYFPERLRNLLPKKKSPTELDKHYDNIELEKGDFLAMVIAAFLTFMPILLIAMAVIYGILLLFVR